MSEFGAQFKLAFGIILGGAIVGGVALGLLIFWLAS